VSLRQKLLLVFSLTVVLAVATVAGIISFRTRRAFADADQKHAAALVEQFQRELQGYAEDVSERVDRLAASERMSRVAFDLTQTGGDAAPYLYEAATLARDYQLDFLEILSADGSIVSSAQWPARFGYKDELPTPGNQPGFLKREELPDGRSEIGLFARRKVGGSDEPRSARNMGESFDQLTGIGGPIYVLGGRRLDRRFLANLAAPADTSVLLYPVLTTSFDPRELVSASGEVAQPARYQPLIEQARATKKPAEGVIYLTNRREDSVDATAVPLAAPDGSVLAVMVVANPRRAFVELQQHIRAIAYGVAGAGILLAILASLWIASRVSRPIERLAAAASQVAAGQWSTQVEVTSDDEIGELAASFNHMTHQLSDQRERLVQSERVAAWRELARRLAHELKNPLFPLQLTVENLIKARRLPAEEFDEIFDESTATLTAEIANLKNIIARFSDFSKMPKPQLEEVDAASLISNVVALYEPALAQHRPPILLSYVVGEGPLRLDADTELLHRALSNLVLNAMDAMPNGGTLTIEARPKDDGVQIKISDTGTGMTAEECERLFTPYYTTKQHGTGLGLAIVQSVVSDHHGTIHVESTPGSGSTFVVELPRNGNPHPSKESLGTAPAVGEAPTEDNDAGASAKVVST
jgi:two-component system, NtrC family, nitrogen regulation sensor histidine kinase NtrY